ncbi:hypothetical protein LCGC14_2345270, partial [marine sediment metagenome]
PERVHYRLAKRDHQKLLGDWGVTKKVLLAEAASKDREAVLAAVNAFVLLRRPDGLDGLAELTRTRGSVALAEACIATRLAPLRKAAEVWAGRNNYQVKSDGRLVPKKP